MTRTHIVAAVAAVAAAAAFSFAAPASAQVRATVYAPGPYYGPGPRAVEVEQEGFNREGFSIAGNVGFIAASDSTTGFAIGGRAGYTFPFKLYLGGDVTVYPVSGTALISIAPEIGFDLGLRRIPMVIRPYVGLGVADVTAAGKAFFEFYPGVEVLYYVTHNFFVGGDARIPFIFESFGESATVDGVTVAAAGSTAVGINLMATIGYKF